MRLYATNTSRKTEDFIDNFATDTLANGNQKIFTFSQLPSVADYDEKSSLLTVTKVSTNQEVIKVDQKKVIKSSFSPHILEAAFTSSDGVNQFQGYLLGQMESAKEAYIYEMIVTDLYGKSVSGKRDHQIKTTDLSSIKDLTDMNNGMLLNQKKIALEMQKDIQNLQVYNDQYNAKSYKQAIDIGDMRLVMAAPYDNDQVVNLFAQLLRSSEINDTFEKPAKLTIPEIAIPSPSTNGKVIGFLMDKRAYQYFYKFVFMGDFFDVSNLCINNFLHFWFGKGFLDNLAFIKFTEVPTALPASK